MIYIDGNISYIYIGSEQYDEVYVGSSKVYPAIPVGDKFTATYTGGRELAVPCDGNTTLTYENVRPSGYTATAMTSAVVGDCVTTLGDGAFGLCYSLTSVTIPNSVTSIARTVFHICSALTSVNLPDSVRSIGQGAFEYCFSLTSVTLPTGITTLEDYTFVGCSGLTSITVPSGVTSIGNSCFQGCSGLSWIKIESTTPPTLAGSVFDDTNDCPIIVPCGSLQAYKGATTWQPYVSRLVDDCLSKLSLRTAGGEYNKNCDSSTALSEQDVTGLVSDKSAILEATIGGCVTSISDGAFSAATNMTDVHIPSNVTMIGMNAFNSCSSLQSVVILGQYLSANAFFGCGLRLLELVDVSYIGISCFRYNANLTSVTIPATCEEIAGYAFADGTSLQEVTMLGETPPTLGENVFADCDILTVIYVPHDALQAYLDDTSWQPYASLLQESPE